MMVRTTPVTMMVTMIVTTIAMTMGMTMGAKVVGVAATTVIAMATGAVMTDLVLARLPG
jgi:hypothetical protein